MIVRVKICGLVRDDDIRYVNRYMPDYAGFVFAESRRRITVERASEMITALDGRIKAAGVFVNEDIGNIAAVTAICGLEVVQLHGNEPPEYLKRLRTVLEGLDSTGRRKNGSYADSMRGGIEIWKAVRVCGPESIDSLRWYDADAFVLDTYVEGSYGGSGRIFDWRLAAEAGRLGKIVLAGGLNYMNVCDAIRQVKPFAVDVSSGVEQNGCKDEILIGNFIKAVRNL